MFERFRGSRRLSLVIGGVAGLLAAVAGPAAAKDLDRVTVGMGWYAQAEQAGFYAAKAEGIYARYGLDVTIRDGGPNVNGTQLLLGGTTDFQTGFSLNTLNAVEQGIPLVSVAAIMQTDPQTLMVHADAGYDALEDLKGAPIKIPTTGRVAYWPWLKSKYGFSDDQLRPYSFTLGPFAADDEVAQQGYVTNDGFYLKQAGIDAKSILLADYGWSPYGYTIDTTARMVCEHPDVVRRFVEASFEGYRHYMRDPGPGNALIKQRNPDQSDALLAFSLAKMKEYGIIDSHEAAQYGLGAMSNARWAHYFQQMVDAGVLPADLDYTKGYTLQFVGHPDGDELQAVDCS